MKESEVAAAQQPAAAILSFSHVRNTYHFFPAPRYRHEKLIGVGANGGIGLRGSDLRTAATARFRPKLGFMQSCRDLIFQTPLPTKEINSKTDPFFIDGPAEGLHCRFPAHRESESVAGYR